MRIARVINIEERKTHKSCQELGEALFAFLNAYKYGTDFQKKTTKKRFVRCLENAHELMEGSGKLLKIKKPDKIVSYRTDAKMVHVIKKPT